VQITRLAAGRRARVIPSDTIRASHRIGAPPRSAPRRHGKAGGKADMRRQFDHAGGVDHAHRHALFIGVKRARSASARIVAKDWR
jgi:hypothetical protein